MAFDNRWGTPTDEVIPLHHVNMSGKSLSEGIETHLVAGIPVRVYDTLDRSNFLPQESKLMILGKGTLELQSIDLNPAVVTAINDYLLVKLASENPALFVSNNGHRLDGKDIARIVKKYAEPVGIVGVAYRR
jgi:site-specific recombinase XerC